LAELNGQKRQGILLQICNSREEKKASKARGKVYGHQRIASAGKKEKIRKKERLGYKGKQIRLLLPN